MVYIGIVTYNSRADIPTCLECLNMQTYPNIRITVHDNASTDGTAAWLQQQSSVDDVIVNDINLGFGRAHNAILRRLNVSPEDYYLPLNPDARLAADYVTQLVAGLERHSAGWGIGKLKLPDGRLYSAGHALLWNGYAFNVGHNLSDSAIWDEEREVWGASGAAVLISGALIRDVGVLYDPHLFLYAEDTDLDWRARHLGWDCWYIPSAQAIHPGGAITQEALAIQAVANRYRSVIKNAHGLDLIFRNVPFLTMHLLLRLILSPRMGWLLLRLMMQHVPSALRQRQPLHMSRSEQHYWFQWSNQQATGQPRRFMERLQAWYGKRIRVQREP
jgi:GT2 family glycosyltransferase